MSGDLHRKKPGLISRATVMGQVSADGKITVEVVGNPGAVQVPVLPAYYTESGHFIGSKATAGTPITLLQGTGGEYFALSPTINPSKFREIQIDSKSLLITDKVNRINLNPDAFITLGSVSTNLRVDHKRSILSDNFKNKFSVGEASISVDGIIKRDLNPREMDDNLFRRDSHDYKLSEVCFDPSSTYDISTTNSSGDDHSNNTARNVPFVEKRELVYEFAQSYNFANDKIESSFYTSNPKPRTSPKYNRRQSRADVLSLSLEAPNYLIETVKGTVVDIYGNILDINRNILPAGKEKEYSFKTNDDKLDVFKRLRAIERKSIAYHFEINARKGPVSRGGQLNPFDVVGAPDVNDTEDFARLRSRFFVDIDKEGQLKVNIPASSETGNIPLLARYENASTIEAQANGTDPNEWSPNDQPSANRDQRRDIFLDSFAYNGGSIEIHDPENSTAYSTPIDRISKKPLKHGTVYHDITKALYAFSSEYVNYEYEPQNLTLMSLEFSPVVSDKITVSGPKANAGGRSGSFNFDGMVELNIGSNTVDKQSMWIDTHGGIVAQIGRDKNHVSAGINMTGDLLLQVGGCDSGDISGNSCDNEIKDSRFAGQNFAFRPGAIDIRVFHDNSECTVVRIDNSGVTVQTPADLKMVSGGTMLLKANKLDLDAEEINFFSNDPSSIRSMIRNNKSIL